MGQIELEVFLRGRVELFDRVAFGGVGAVHKGAVDGERSFDDSRMQSRFGAEVVVDRADRDTRAGGDLLDRHEFGLLFGEHLLGGAQQGVDGALLPWIHGPFL
jgi:hypothetical protein